MQGILTNPGITIKRGELCVMHLQAGQAIRLVEGRIWLTEQGHAADVILCAGETHVLRSTGKLLIEAADQARLQVQTAPQTQLAEA